VRERKTPTGAATEAATKAAAAQAQV
jgi:hypothetical protein